MVDIKNEKLFFLSEKAFGATLLIKYDALRKEEITINKFQYVNSHDSVYLCVQRDIASVGGGIRRTLNRFSRKKDLKVIYTTDEYPSHPISIRNTLKAEIRLQIKKALLSMPKKLLKPISDTKIIESSNQEYLIIEELIKKLHLNMGKK